MKKPQLLSEIDKYSFILTDFPSRFERSIFMAINGLYKNGATKIQPIDIENFIEPDQVSAKLFKDKNGIEYLQDIGLDLFIAVSEYLIQPVPLFL